MGTFSINSQTANSTVMMGPSSTQHQHHQKTPNMSRKRQNNVPPSSAHQLRATNINKRPTSAAASHQHFNDNRTSNNPLLAGTSERVDLSRRGLTRCPFPANPASIFLLNLEHNLIRSMDGLSSQLSNLVVLSLYDNQLDKMCGLEGLVSLKLLLLGRNRISKIESINQLPNLEVLDLHGNQISSSHQPNNNNNNNSAFSSLKGHPKLRVLNLASNRLVSIDGLVDLPHLIELNLRRNKIRAMSDPIVALAGVNHLQRIYLSHNQISRVEDLLALKCIPTLKELGISNNPVLSNNKQQQHVKPFLLDMCPRLQILDGEQITDEARLEAAEKIKELEERAKRSAELLVKEDVIDNAKKRWEFLKSEAIKMSKTQNRTFHHVLAASGYTNNKQQESDDEDHINKRNINNKTNKHLNRPAQQTVKPSQQQQQQQQPVIKPPLNPDALETIFPLTAKLSKTKQKVPGTGVTSIHHIGPNSKFRPKTAAPALLFQPMNKNRNIDQQQQQQQNAGADNKPPRIPAIMPSKIDLSLNPSATSNNFKYTNNFALQGMKTNNLQTSDSGDDSSNQQPAVLRQPAHQHPKSLKTVSSMLRFLSKSSSNIKHEVDPAVHHKSKKNHFSKFIPARRNDSSSNSEDDSSSNESNTESEDAEPHHHHHRRDKGSEVASSCKSRSSKQANRNESESESTDESPINGVAPRLPPAAGATLNMAENTIVPDNRSHQMGPSSSGISTNNKTYKQGKDFVIEIQDGVLSLYGQDSLKYMEARWIADASLTVTRAKFQFIQHDDLVVLYPKFKERFPNLAEFHFRETCLDRLGQLNGLATFPKMTSLYISSEGNSIVHHPQWRLYAIYRLGNRGLKVINGEPVEPDDVIRATEAFSFLSQLVFSCQTRETILQLYCHVSTMQQQQQQQLLLQNSDQQSLAIPNGEVLPTDGSNSEDQQRQQQWNSPDVQPINRPRAGSNQVRGNGEPASNNPSILQEAIGREALCYQPLPATRETALLKRSRAMNFMQRVVARYTSTAGKLTKMDSTEEELLRRLVLKSLARTLVTGNRAC